MFGFSPFASAPFADTGGVTPIPVTVYLTGVEAVGQVGQVQTTGDAFVYLTGVQGNTELGTASVTSYVDVYLTGVQGVGIVGTVDAQDRKSTRLNSSH